MIKTIRVKDNNIIDYLGNNIDAITELTNNSTCAPGSTCYLVETGETYIKKIDNVWVVKVDASKAPADLSEYIQTDFSGAIDTRVVSPNIIKTLPEITIDILTSNFSNMFSEGIKYCNDLKLNIKSKPEDCSNMFYNAFLSKIEFNQDFDTSNVTRMTGMFWHNNIISLDVSMFNTSNVTDMRYMFAECQKLEELDLSNFNTSNVTDMSGMFNFDIGLKKLDISSFDFTNVTEYNNMFGSITAIGEGTIDFRVPANCNILVKDLTAKEWLTSKFNWLTNIHYVGE